MTVKMFSSLERLLWRCQPSLPSWHAAYAIAKGSARAYCYYQLANSLMLQFIHILYYRAPLVDSAFEGRRCLRHQSAQVRNDGGDTGLLLWEAHAVLGQASNEVLRIAMGRVMTDCCITLGC